MPPPPGATCADPDLLDAAVAATEPADLDLRAALAGLGALVEGWDARPSAHGGRIDGAAVAALDTAADELAHLDTWVGRVADGFRDVTRLCPTSGCGRVVHAADHQIARIAGPPGLGDAMAGGAWDHLVTVVRDGSDGRTRVVRLEVDTLPEGMSGLEWQLLLEGAGLTGEDGPLHLVVHGWGTTTAGATGAGEVTADLYDQQGVEGATVLVVDWDAGDGADPFWEAPGDFSAAERSARATGDGLAPMLTALAAAHPDAVVNVTAHSLGGHVVARALTGMEDPTARFSVSLLLVQPAIPRRAPTWDPDHYGALAGLPVRDLTVTINAGDDALFWYELRGEQALGDEAADGPGITDLVARREAAGLATTVVDHDSPAGGGHLGLRPDAAQPRVRSLTQEVIDADLGDGTAQADVRGWIDSTYPGPTADRVLGHPAVQAYLDERQRLGRPPTVADVQAIIDEEVLPVRPTPSPRPTPAPVPVG